MNHKVAENQFQDQESDIGAAKVEDQEEKCLAFNTCFTKLTLITGEVYYIVLLSSYELLIDLF